MKHLTDRVIDPLTYSSAGATSGVATDVGERLKVLTHHTTQQPEAPALAYYAGSGKGRRITVSLYVTSSYGNNRILGTPCGGPWKSLHFAEDRPQLYAFSMIEKQGCY